MGIHPVSNMYGISVLPNHISCETKKRNSNRISSHDKIVEAVWDIKADRSTFLIPEAYGPVRISSNRVLSLASKGLHNVFV